MSSINSDNNHKDEEQFLLPEEPEEIPAQSILRKITLGAVAALAIAGMIYLSGVYPLFFYWRTPSVVEEREIPAEVEGEIIIIPLHVYVLATEGELGSERTEENVARLVANASKIWGQARLGLEVVKITRLPLSDQELSVFYDNPGKFISSLPEFDARLITVILVKYLSGINGIAFGGWQTTAVADYTARSYDFRTLAHEIGHLLGLDHVENNTSRLMYRGANGAGLTLEEIERARSIAEELYGR